ncbi:MAG TPA: arylsulfotransferase family protein, partial [bacterium]|nr:arylsulfotransferase family protein [bacterium]
MKRPLIIAGVLVFAVGGGILGGFSVSELDLPLSKSLGRVTRHLRQYPAFVAAVQRIKGPPRNPGAAPGLRGHWGRTAPAGAAGDSAAAGGPSQDDFERLRAIGYLGAEEEAPATSGVVIHDAERASGTRLLWTSGHAALAVLMERDGTILHAWRRTFEEAFPGVPAPADRPSYHYFRKAWLGDDGDLLVIFEGQAIMKLDRDSNILWAKLNHAHHDFHVLPSGEILVLTREVHVQPDYHPRRPILEDFISLLTPDGEEIRRVSMLDAVRNSRYSGLLDYSPEWGDIMHNNTLQILGEGTGGLSPELAPGHAVVSFNKTNVIGVVDLEEERMTWAIVGLTDGNHDPIFLENGNLLVFDNAGGEGDHSRVLEVDPFTQEIVWSYDGDEANGFYSWCCGTSHRLPNGNTLITETSAGRAFEVTPGNEIVWEFINPHRNRPSEHA